MPSYDTLVKLVRGFHVAAMFATCPKKKTKNKTKQPQVKKTYVKVNISVFHSTHRNESRMLN